MDFMNLSKLLLWKELCHANESWPQATMDKGNSAVDEAAHEYILATADCLREFEDFVASRMRPPASANGLTRYGNRQCGHGAGGRLEDDAVLAYEVSGLTGSHVLLAPTRVSINLV